MLVYVDRVTAIAAVFLLLSVVLGGLFGSRSSAASVTDSDPLVMRMVSPYSLEETVEQLKRSIGNHNFRVVREQRLAEGLPMENETPANDHVVIYFCNFSMLNDTLRKDKTLGFVLPCRFTVSRINGQTVIQAMLPSYFTSKASYDSELKNMCQRIRDNYLSIAQEATL